MKKGLCTIIGIVGSCIASLFGGFDAAMITLMLFMGTDYVSGLVVAGVFHKSKKSESGALESGDSWKGLCRKGMTLVVVIIANETPSIIENAGLMGVNIPAPLTKAIEVLKNRGSESE